MTFNLGFFATNWCASSLLFMPPGMIMSGGTNWRRLLPGPQQDIDGDAKSFRQGKNLLASLQLS